MARAVCSIEGCERPASGRGWCAAHYYHWRRYGDPLHAPYGSADDRFWSKVDRAHSCWIWRAACRGDGYGAFSVKGRQIAAHRYSYEVHHGEIPQGMVVMHTCDRPTCVNPAHLRLATNAENAADSARKARRPRGSRQHAAKLTEGQVLDLRARYAAGGVSQKELAAEYGVSHALVSNIITRRIWNHI
jgi:hypothetical protein